MTDVPPPAYQGPKRVFSGMQPTNGLHPTPGQRLATVREHPQGLQLAVDLQHRQGLGAHRNHRDRMRIQGIGVAIVTGVEQPNSRGKLGRHV